MVWSLDTNPEWFFLKIENSQAQIRTFFWNGQVKSLDGNNFFKIHACTRDFTPDSAYPGIYFRNKIGHMDVWTIILGKSQGGQVQCGQIGGASVREKGAFSGSDWSLSCRGPYLTSGFDWAYSNFQTNVNQRGRLRPPPTNPFPTFLPFHWTMWYA